MSDICVWDMGTECDGEIKTQNMFIPQIQKFKPKSNEGLLVSICDKHFTEHREVMACIKYGFNIEKIIRWGPNIRYRIMKHFNILPEKR